MEIHAQIQGLEELKRRLNGVPEELNRQERAIMHQAVIMVRDEARSQIHSPAGRAARGIQADVQELSGFKVFGRIRSRNVAAVFSQRSRGPNRKQPPTNRIRRWLIRMGGDPTPQQVYLVARSIGRRGTTGRPIMRAAYEARSQQVQRMFMDALRAAVHKVAGG